MHIPPRSLFFSQIFAELIGIPINYAVLRWVIRDKGDYVIGKKQDPFGEWTDLYLFGYNNDAIQYVVIGTKRFFNIPMYRCFPYGYLAGALAAAVLFVLHRYFPKARFDLWNVTVFSTVMSIFLGYMSTGNTSRFIVAYMTMYFYFRRRFRLWSRYNYLVAAALDAAFNINLLLTFIFFGSGKQISMPNWWGNNAKSVERCFALNPSDTTNNY